MLFAKVLFWNKASSIFVPSACCHPAYIVITLLLESKVVIEIIYVLGFREGLWHILGIILCTFCISANFLGLAVLPGQVPWLLGRTEWHDTRIVLPGLYS